MIVFKTQITKKEKLEVEATLKDLIDLYRDFYLTKNNIRLFIKENMETLCICLKGGDKIAYDKEGVGVVTGFSDKMKRKYVKILAKDNEVADKIIKIILLNVKTELYIKIKRNNPIKKVLIDNGFKEMAGRGKELLLVNKIVRRK